MSQWSSRGMLLVVSKLSSIRPRSADEVIGMELPRPKHDRGALYLQLGCQLIALNQLPVRRSARASLSTSAADARTALGGTAEIEEARKSRDLTRGALRVSARGLPDARFAKEDFAVAACGPVVPAADE